MSDAQVSGPRRGIRFDPTINLGHLTSMGVTLVMVGMAWANLDARQVNAAAAIAELKMTLAAKADKDSVGKGEVELSRRITEQQSVFNQTQLRTSEDVREIKTLIRDISERLDRKADKPGR